MIGDNRNNFRVDFVAVPTVQEVGHTVGLLTAHENHFFGLGRIGDMPIHIEFPGNRRKCSTELLKTKRNRLSFNFVTHEKPTTVSVGVVACFGYPAIVSGQKITHLGDNSHPIRARNHKTIGMLHESLSLTEKRESRCDGNHYQKLQLEKEPRLAVRTL